MLRWPNIIEGRWGVTVTGTHQTPKRREFGGALMALTGLTLMVHPFFTTHSPANVAAFKALVGLLPAADRGNIAAGLLVGQFVLGFVALGLGANNHHAYGWLVSRRTTVKVDAATVQVHGIRYDREQAAVQFTNLFPHTVTVGTADGRHAMLGSLEETATLRMSYGPNAVIVAEFLTARQAGRFALACNAALGRAVTPGAGGFDVIPLAELYRGGLVTEAQPARRPVPALPSGAARHR